MDIVWKIMGWTLSNIGMFGTKQSWFVLLVCNAHLNIATFRIYAPWFSEQYYACIRFVCNLIIKRDHFASNTNRGQKEFFASEIHFVLLQRAPPSFALFLSLSQGGKVRWRFLSMHYSSSMTDTNWAAATAEGLPVNVCVPASNQNRACWHTHTQPHGDKQDNPCPSSLSAILNQRIDPWRTHREFVEILTDTHDPHGHKSPWIDASCSLSIKHMKV